MKPDWDKLADEFKDSPIVQIFDVDCTAGGKALCNSVGVRGYPTIKYYQADDDNAQDYRGGRTFDALKTFTETTFQPGCNIETLENCNPDQKKIIGELKGKDAAVIGKRLKEVNENLSTKQKELRDHEKATAAKTAELNGQIKDIQKSVSMVKKIAKAGGVKHDEL